MVKTVFGGIIMTPCLHVDLDRAGNNVRFTYRNQRGSIVKSRSGLLVDSLSRWNVEDRLRELVEFIRAEYNNEQWGKFLELYTARLGDHLFSIPGLKDVYETALRSGGEFEIAIEGDLNTSTRNKQQDIISSPIEFWNYEGKVAAKEYPTFKRI